jgi:hypothetical protein
MEEGADAKNARSAVTTLINMLQNGPCKGKVGWTDSLYQLMTARLASHERCSVIKIQKQ